MADGSRSAPRQHAFNIPFREQVCALRPGEIIVDLFAGGGGASEALRQALGRDPDIAINHDEQAIGMHSANHPMCRHLREDVWQANPVHEVGGRDVGWLHFSPDCTHHSQASAGQPRDRAIRSLAWVGVKWAGSLARVGRAPRIISMENVQLMKLWGPLQAKRCKLTGRVVKRDGSVASKGEHVPVREQFLVPDKRRAGSTWDRFVASFRALGYTVEWRTLRACDYGAGTSRERLFLIARRDGAPIVWPDPTHGKGLLKPVAAADCLDWSLPCPSIFTRKKPLADATHRRIARGIKRFVLEANEVFLVPGAAPAALTLVQTGYGERTGQAPRALDLSAPLGTIVAGGVKHAVASAHLVKMRGDSLGSAATDPVPTITSGAGAKRPAGCAHALGAVTVLLEQANGGFYKSPGRDVREPVPTICSNGSLQRLVSAELAAPTAAHDKAVRKQALRVADFLIANGMPDGGARTAAQRLALVTVHVRGVPHLIVDIGLRMLQPRELYLAQGFDPDYIIDRTADGRRLSNSAAVKMVGNSVSPPPLRALAQANTAAPTEQRRAA